MSSAVEDISYNPPLVENYSALASPTTFQYQQAFSVPQTPGGALSVRSGMSNGPDLMPLNELVGSMKGALDHLGGVFDSLGEHTARVASLAPAMQAAHQIKQLKRQLAVQDSRQEERVQNLKVLLRDVIKAQIGDHLRYHIHLIIQERVQKEVARRVEEELNKQFPPKLRDQLNRHKNQLEGVKRSLWDEEARRHNALLKDHHLDDPMAPLMMDNGGISTIFPKTLRDLFSTNAEEAKQLAMEYNLPYVEGVHSEREDNLNLIMHHFGTQFHVEPPPPRETFRPLQFAM